MHKIHGVKIIFSSPWVFVDLIWAKIHNYQFFLLDNKTQQDIFVSYYILKRS